MLRPLPFVVGHQRGPYRRTDLRTTLTPSPRQIRSSPQSCCREPEHAAERPRFPCRRKSISSARSALRAARYSPLATNFDTSNGTPIQTRQFGGVRTQQVQPVSLGNGNFKCVGGARAAAWMYRVVPRQTAYSGNSTIAMATARSRENSSGSPNAVVHV